MAITAQLVKELRERTGAGMMECKKFLQKTAGDIETAIEEMRKEGVMKAAKKEGRIAAEGLVAVNVAADGQSAVMLEVNCETDFVTRGDDFNQFVDQVAQLALEQKTNDVAALLAANFGSVGTVEEARQALIAKIGENINIRRVEFLQATGNITGYVHGGRIGVLVDITGGSEDLRKDIAMHVAACQPIVVKEDQVPAELIAKEREIYAAQAAESGKPQDIIEKMINGRISKFVGEVSLLGQPFVKDPSTKVESLLKDAQATANDFVRFAVGEGIEKKQVDFAKEVMEQARGGN